MARFTYLFALTLAACVYAVPLHRRQDQCDAARDAIVASLEEANTALATLATAAADDAAAVDGLAEAEAGLQQANDGVDAVAAALEQGEAPPQAARDQVVEGLEATLAALSTLVQVEDSAFAPELIDAQSAVVATIDAGDLVLEACGAAAGAEDVEDAAEDVAADAEDAAEDVAADAEDAAEDVAADVEDAAEDAAADVEDAAADLDAADDLAADAEDVDADAEDIEADAVDTAAAADITAPPAAAADAAATVTVTVTVTDAACATAAADADADLQAEELDAADEAEEKGAALELPGSDECNIARGQVIDGLALAGTDITALLAEANVEAAALLGDGLVGVDNAQAGVNTIIHALVAGDAPPAEARDEVDAGLTEAVTAVTAAAAADPAIAEQTDAILAGLADTGSAGSDVLALCV